MSGPFKMKGWGGYQNSPVKKEEKKEQSMRTISFVDKVKEKIKSNKEFYGSYKNKPVKPTGGSQYKEAIKLMPGIGGKIVAGLAYHFSKKKKKK